MSRSRFIQLVGLLACVGLLGVAASRMPTINEGRRALNLMGADSPLENTPPEYVFYIQAFGAFRGLIADIAFIRADQLKQAGRFYDAMQLHQWICALQPHFPGVWEYASWNLAWNISVTTFTPEERWNWVYNGVKLLRDHGIPLNPKAVNLYKQLAWTFNNKMGENTDEQHYAYKCNWAWRMHLVLGPPPDPLAGADPATLAADLTTLEEPKLLEEAARRTYAQSQEKLRKAAENVGLEAPPMPDPAAIEAGRAPALTGSIEFKIAQRAAADQLRPIRDAAPTLAELYPRHPEARRMVSELRALGTDLSDTPLTEDAYWREGGLAHAFFLPYRALVNPAGFRERFGRESRAASALQERMDALGRILGLPTGDPAGAALVQYLQRKVLREVYKLDPAFLLELVETFGPIDWRSVDAQGLYWAARGLVAGGDTVSKFGNDKTNTARIMFFCLRSLFLRGHLVFEPNPDAIHASYLNLSRDLNMIEPMHRAYVQYGALFDPTGDVPGLPGTYRGGHINFLTEAIRLLYLAGREAEAAGYYRALRQLYPRTPDGRPEPMFAKSLHDFVLDSFRDSLFAPASRDILIIVDAWLIQAYDALAAGDFVGYARHIRAARDYHESFMRDKRDDPLTRRTWLKDFAQLQVDAFGAYLARPSRSSAFTLHKTRLWQNAPLPLRQGVYDDLLPLLKSECEFYRFDVARAFPEPSGMDEYRRQRPPRGEELPESDTRTLPRVSG